MWRREGRGTESLGEAACIRLIDNHRQVVPFEKGAEVTSARYHQARLRNADRSIISR